jgi:prenyl protein peptidase
MPLTPRATVLTTIGYDLMIVLLFYTRRYVCPSISAKTYRSITFNLCTLLFAVLIDFLEFDFHLFHCVVFSLLAIVSTVVLFVVPLIQSCFAGFHVSSRAVKKLLMAPAGEELIYRAFTCSFWRSCGFGLVPIVFLSPVLFGLSHFHHFFLGSGPRRIRLLQSLLQCCFATVFGWWVAFIWCGSHAFFVFLLSTVSATQ